MPATRYSDQERAAVVAAFEQPNVTAAQVVRLAAAGEIVTPDGLALPAFEIRESTVRDMKRRAHAQRSTTPPDRPPENDTTDPLERAYARLYRSIDAQLEAIEKKPAGSADTVRALHAAAKATNELAALDEVLKRRHRASPSTPTTGDDATPAPPTLADRIIGAHRAGPPVPEEPAATATPRLPASPPAPQPSPHIAPVVELALRNGINLSA